MMRPGKVRQSTAVLFDSTMPTVTSLILTISLVGAVADEPAYATSRTTAKNQFLAERFAEAAQGFEALWTEYQRLPDLYAAGLARYRLSHNAHAIDHWERFLELAAASNFQDPKVERAKRQLEDARKLVVPTPLTIELHNRHPSTSAQVRIQHEGSPRPILVKELDVRAGLSTTTVGLDKGTWTLTVDVDGVAKTESISIPASGALRFVFGAPTVVPRRVRRKLSLGLSLSGVALVGAGGATAIAIQRHVFIPATNVANPCGPNTLFACTKKVQDALAYREVGSHVMGVGTGLLVTGLTTLTPQAHTRRAAWLTEAAIGGIFAGAGAGIYFGFLANSIGTESLQCNDGEDPCKPPEKSESKKWDANYISELTTPGKFRFAGALLLSTGAGLLTGATIGLLVQRPYLRKRTREQISRVTVSPHFSNHHTGLTFSGVF